MVHVLAIGITVAAIGAAGAIGAVLGAAALSVPFGEYAVLGAAAGADPIRGADGGRYSITNY